MLSGNLASAPEPKVWSARNKSQDREVISVCHLISGDLWAGAEAQAAALLKHLSASERLRVAAVVLNEGRLAQELRKCGVEVEVIPENELGFFAILRIASKYIHSRHVSVLHSHRYKENLLAALLAWRCGVPFVVRTAHGGTEPFRGVRCWKQMVLQKIDRLVARLVTDRVISVSSELSRQIARYVAPAKIAIIRNGLDISTVRSRLSAEEAKRRLGIPEDCLVLGYAGRLEPVKRLDLFLAAAAEVAVRFPHVRFVIAGDGSEASWLRGAIRKASLDERVMLLGYRDDIYDVLRAFEIFLLCSNHEGLPMVLLEALHLGVPVVARRVGGIPEVVGESPGEASGGVLVDSDSGQALAEACARLLQDAQLRKRLARAGQLRVAQAFSGASTAAEVCNVYISLCATL